ncbi:MAG: hypothetical protein PHH00_01390 [Candidatus Nanoarchaeia archaeon]|nr:hypothetical protein [Candidatus Nanoarchaeia archaeon]
MKQNNKVYFFETPNNKLRAFQSPRLVMYSEGQEVSRWDNTQPLYFYPLSWLDYLNTSGVRELYVIDSSINEIRNALNSLRAPGKVHFETPNPEAIKIAKDLGHKVSVICNLDELTSSHIPILAGVDFIRIRAGSQSDLTPLSPLPNEGLLSGIKTYIGENCDYGLSAIQAREIGFDFFQIAKRLMTGEENLQVGEEERTEIRRLRELATEKFRVIIPKSLERRFAERFRISPSFNNVSSCDFSKYRLVLKNGRPYPCYTRGILAQQPGYEKPRDCLDCACIYENDMLHDIKSKMQRYKEPSFALEYQDD